LGYLVVFSQLDEFERKIRTIQLSDFPEFSDFEGAEFSAEDALSYFHARIKSLGETGVSINIANYDCANPKIARCVVNLTKELVLLDCLRDFM